MKDRCVTTLQGFNQLLFDSTGFFVKLQINVQVYDASVIITLNAVVLIQRAVAH